MTTSTVGDGPIRLVAAVEGFLPFEEAGVVNGDLVGYSVMDTAHSEIGRGVYRDGTLTRQVLKSTNGHRPIMLTGSAIVAITPAAEDFSTEALINAMTKGFDLASARIAALEQEIATIKSDLGEFYKKLGLS